MRTYKPPYSYILCFVLLLGLISIPTSTAMRLKGATVATLSPLWSTLAIANPFSRRHQPDPQLQQLRLENQQLKERLSLMGQAYIHSAQISFETTEHSPLAAQVIYRPFNSWNHSLWIDIGWEHNPHPEHPVLAKDSPVVLGDAIVGVIDYVGKHHSRVRLLSDPGVIPSVRVARGRPQALALLHSVDEVLDQVNEQEEVLTEHPEIRLHLLSALETLKAQLLDQKAELYLAKGELCGIDKTRWGRGTPILRGRGFNYDFADQYGPSRDLRSGRPEGNPDAPPIPLIQPQDLLVTTGMDGIFPSDLRVATVIDVAPLHEGAYTYNLTAKPAVNTLQTLTTVFVLPPRTPSELRYKF